MLQNLGILKKTEEPPHRAESSCDALAGVTNLAYRECLDSPDGETEIYTVEDPKRTQEYSIIEWPRMRYTSSVLQFPKNYSMQDYWNSRGKTISITWQWAKAHLNLNTIEFMDGTSLKILYISDVFVYEEERWKSHGKSIEAIIGDIAKRNDCDAICSVLMAEESQEKLVANKQKAGYSVYDTNRTLKALTLKGEEYRETLLKEKLS